MGYHMILQNISYLSNILFMGKLIEDKDYYYENGFVVLTESYLKNRKFCCGARCKHCPFEPEYKKGSTNIKK
jgi:hypothetical protein